MVPGVFAADGCGEGTVLVDGVCQLAPEESNDGCGEGTILVDEVCQLDESSGTQFHHSILRVERLQSALQ